MQSPVPTENLWIMKLPMSGSTTRNKQLNGSTMNLPARGTLDRKEKQRNERDQRGEGDMNRRLLGFQSSESIQDSFLVFLFTFAHFILYATTLTRKSFDCITAKQPYYASDWISSKVREVRSSAGDALLYTTFYEVYPRWSWANLSLYWGCSKHDDMVCKQ